MKKLAFIFSLATIMLSLHSCIDGIHSDEPPYCVFSRFYKMAVIQNDSVVAAKDSLSNVYDAALGDKRLDTITLGDTVHFRVAYCSDYNPLVSIHIEYDTLALAVTPYINFSDPQIKKIIMPDYTLRPFNAYLYAGYDMFMFDVSYYALKEGCHPLKFIVYNNASETDNGTSYTFYQPVK